MASFELEESKEDMSNEPDWLCMIQQQLHRRDLREKTPFQHISISYNLLLDENVDLSKRVSNLSQAVLQLKQDNWNKPSLFLNTSPSHQVDTDSTDTVSDDNSKKSKKSKKSKNKNKDDDNAPNTNYEVESLKNENDSLRKELMDVYRLKKENEEALSRLKKQHIENEELIIQQNKSLNEFAMKHQTLVEDHNELKEGINISFLYRKIAIIDSL